MRGALIKAKPSWQLACRTSNRLHVTTMLMIA